VSPRRLSAAALWRAAAIVGVLTAASRGETATRGMNPFPPMSATVTSLFTPVQPVAPSSTLAAAVAPGATLAAPVSPGATVAVAGAPSSTVAVAGLTATVTGTPGGIKPKPGGPPPKPAIVVPYEELHKHASLVIMPSAFSAHYSGPTGENAEVFLAWYIGTLYNEKGLFIAPIFSLFVGADLKWAIIGEKDIRPAFAFGYYGGLAQPFTGGAVKASSLAGQQAIKQSFVHDAYLVMGKHFGPVSFDVGAMRGFKRAFPQFIPMLRNTSYTTTANPASPSLWTAFGGMDLALKEQHIKIEVITLPEETVNRPWLIESHVDSFLGFDLAYLKDRIGYEVIGYYLLPFYRWPDKKRLEKEAEKAARARKPV